MTSESNYLSIRERFLLFLKQPKETVVVRTRDTVLEEPIHELMEDNPDTSAEAMYEYAIFSDLTYGDIQGDVVVVDNTEVTIPEAWRPLLDIPEMPAARREFDLPGLKYQAWFNDSRNEVVLAFRGTRPPKLVDWYSNVRWATRFIPGVRDHYDKVRLYTPLFVEYVRSQFGEAVTITTTGHSLGGGLAQQAAYSSPEIRKVFAFNASPVTGYRSLQKKRRQAGEQGVRIARAFELGEILGHLRFILRQFYPLTDLNPKIVEYRFNFAKGNAVSEHEMGQFAEQLMHHTNTADPGWRFRNVA